MKRCCDLTITMLSQKWRNYLSTERMLQRKHVCQAGKVRLGIMDSKQASAS